MISLITDGGLVFSHAPDVYTEMIRAHYRGYGTGYDFCRFYGQKESGAVLSYYYGSGVLSCPEKIGVSEARELSEFISCGVFSKVMMPSEAAKALGSGKNAPELILMRLSNGIKITDNIDNDAVSTQSSLGEIYEIVSDGFDIDRDMWYTDTSHMLRRGIAEAYSLEGGCAALKMFSSNGISYLSYICTRKFLRGKGLAGRLIGYIAENEIKKGNEVFLFCKKELMGFYESLGFEQAGKAAEIHI